LILGILTNISHRFRTRFSSVIF